MNICAGFLPQNTDDYHRSIKQIAYYDEWKNHRGEYCRYNMPRDV